jgi:hypothetical protein
MERDRFMSRGGLEDRPVMEIRPAVVPAQFLVWNRQIAMRNVPEPRKVYDILRSLAMAQDRDRASEK